MYKLFVTNDSLIMRKETLHDNALSINRGDSSSMRIISKAEVTNQTLRESPRAFHCCLGIFRANRESYLVIVEEASIVGTINLPGSTEQNIIMKINKTDFISFTTGRGVSPIDTEEHPFTQVMNLLNTGYFYWVKWPMNHYYDITRTYQDQVCDPRSDLPFWDRMDKRFYWNKYLQKDFIAYRLLDWCFPIIQGYVFHTSLADIGGKSVDYTLVSRRSRFRAGTRFNTRGIDDDGNVANFVETEQILNIKNFGTLSFLQLRGSVPVFWNQSSPQFTDFKVNLTNLSKIGKVTKKKISVLRSTESTTPAFQSHFKEMLSKYGTIVIVNLLSKLKQGESDLVKAYEEQVNILHADTIQYIPFDLNEEVRGNKMDSLDRIIDQIDISKKVGYFFVTNQRVVTHRQLGTIRTNCKDCLDRTNIVQARIAWRMMEHHLKHLNVIQQHHILESYTYISQQMKTVWADNGDALSMQYAGSGSLKSTLTREGDYGLRGMLADGKKTALRFYVNNFKDTGRQDVLDQLLGLNQKNISPNQQGHDDRIRKQVQERQEEYSSKEYRNVFIGTYNVGGVPSNQFSLDEWLTPPAPYSSPDIYILGIQEVVELTAQQIIATDSQIKQWEDTIKRSLEKINPKVKYVQLQSNQLVGLMMCIYVREELIHLFREVQAQIIKVGLQGLAGNKGGIGVRLMFCDTAFTFVTAHFAAGHGNVEDRISDYHDINNQARFGRQSQYTISDSDYSFWFGDFNFRINLDDEEIKRMVRKGDFAALYDHDQLKENLEAKRVFAGYREEQITFAPTYKYDFNSTQYDTSPKQRAPAWTDRVLWRNKPGYDVRPLHYSRKETQTSDHRPVRIYFQLQVLKVDKDKERQLRHQLYEETLTSSSSSTSSSTSNGKDGANITRSMVSNPTRNAQPPAIITTHSAPALAPPVRQQQQQQQQQQPPGRPTSLGRPLPSLPPNQQQQQDIIQEMNQKRRFTGGSESLPRVNGTTPTPSSQPPYANGNGVKTNGNHSLMDAPVSLNKQTDHPALEPSRTPSPYQQQSSPYHQNSPTNSYGSPQTNNQLALQQQNNNSVDHITDEMFAKLSLFPDAPANGQPSTFTVPTYQPVQQQQQQQQQQYPQQSTPPPQLTYHQPTPPLQQPNYNQQYFQPIPPQQPIINHPPMELLNPIPNPTIYLPPQQMYNMPPPLQQQSSYPPAIDPRNLNPNISQQQLMFMQQQQQQQQQGYPYNQYPNPNHHSLI